MKKIMSIIASVVFVGALLFLTGCSSEEPAYYVTGTFVGVSDNGQAMIVDIGDPSTTDDDASTILNLGLADARQATLPKVGDTVKVGVRNYRVRSVEEVGDSGN